MKRGSNTDHDKNIAIARWRTSQHQDQLEQIQNILRPALNSKHAIDWGKIKNYSVSIEPEPKPVYLEYPPEPKPEGFKYKPHLKYFDTINESMAQERLKERTEEAKNLYLNDYSKWAETVKEIEAENQRRYDESVPALELWNAARIQHEKEITELKSGYENFKPNAIEYYCKLVLLLSKFSDRSRRDFDLEFIPESKILIVDYALPAPDDLIRAKEIKYVKSSGEFVEVLMSKSEFSQFYDDILYQICLRTLHELFDADEIDALKAIVFNGWVESVDKATGNDTKGCVLSVQVKKEEFQKINLSRVEPETCFKALRGIGSPQLHSLTPIAPVVKINREDKRFILSREVENQINEGFNLAAMGWEDFEQLVREIFEKEFTKDGGEVKVTQASRDGGVDAVAFDPDPIHGGKIVIQAKRYTNTVGVAAVRELYGTVLNEGAMKGILITTANYGSDAYEFAKGKPLTLMNGANLLYLLEKHGHKAKIDIAEAKKILSEKI